MRRNHLAACLAVLFVLGVSRAVGAQTPPTPSVCSGLGLLVPSDVIDAALASPATVSGWAVPANRNLRPSRFNSIQTWLSIRNPNIPFHPLFNSVVFVSGCHQPPPVTKPCDSYWTAIKGNYVPYDWAALPAFPVPPFREAEVCGTGKGRYKPYVSKKGGAGQAFCSCTDITQ